MKKHVQQALAALALGMASVSTALAADGEIIVTAGRLAQDPAQVSADVTVIDQNDIRRKQAATVADLLRALPGIDVASNGGPGKTTSVFIRGANSGHTVVLIDGMRVGSATLGSFEWAHLSTADIERIEIVRGPQSSLYGADAMGGVIQIFTKRGRGKAQARLDAEAGSYGTTRATLSAGGSTEAGIGYHVSAASLRSDGVSAYAKGSEVDPYRRDSLSGSVELPVGEGKIEILARSVSGRNALDNSTSDNLSYTLRDRQSVLSAKLEYPLMDFWTTSVQIGRSLDESVARDPNVSWNNSDITTRIDQATWLNDLHFSPVDVLLGLEQKRFHGINLGSFDKRVTQTAGYASASVHFGPATLNGAIRSDRNSDYPDKTTYKLGVVASPIEGVRLTANYGTGFKAPTLNDLFYPGAGNPNLKLETSKGWDVGVHVSGNVGDAKLEAGATWFSQRFENLIAWAPIAPGSFTWKPFNINRATTKGLELSLGLHYGHGYLKANWTALSAKDAKTGDLLPRRAKDSGSIVLGAEAMGLNLEAEVDVVGPRFSSSGNSGYMAGYHTTAVRASYAVNNTWTVRGRIDNLENKHYEQVKGYGVLGRAWYAGVSASF